MESWNKWGSRGPLKVVSPTPCSEQRHLSYNLFELFFLPFLYDYEREMPVFEVGVVHSPSNLVCKNDYLHFFAALNVLLDLELNCVLCAGLG